MMVTVMTVSILNKRLLLIIFVLVVAMSVVSSRCRVPLVAFGLVSMVSSGVSWILMISTTFGSTTPTLLLLLSLAIFAILLLLRSSCSRLAATSLRDDPFGHKIKLPLNLIDVFSS